MEFVIRQHPLWNGKGKNCKRQTMTLSARPQVLTASLRTDREELNQQLHSSRYSQEEAWSQNRNYKSRQLTLNTWPRYLGSFWNRSPNNQPVAQQHSESNYVSLNCDLRNSKVLRRLEKQHALLLNDSKANYNSPSTNLR